MHTDQPQPPREATFTPKWKFADQFVLESTPERTFYVARISDGSQDIYKTGTEGISSFTDAEMDRLAQLFNDSQTRFAQLPPEEKQRINDSFNSLINRTNLPDPKHPLNAYDIVFGISRAVGKEFEELFKQKQLKLLFTQSQAGRSHPQSQ